MNFTAVHSRADFSVPADTKTFRYGREQNHAGRNKTFAPDIQAEIDKLFGCDALILQFPWWWFSFPAILKGWIDRVFAYGIVYDYERFYDRGVLRGRRAMCVITMGAPPNKYAPGRLPRRSHAELMADQ